MVVGIEEDSVLDFVACEVNDANKEDVGIESVEEADRVDGVLEGPTDENDVIVLVEEGDLIE